MRRILRVEVASGSVSLFGTYHPPQDGAATHAAGPGAGKPGVLFINFGQFDRAGPANLTVHLAERLAEHGYPVFRFDMPGLGDTAGDLPEHFETYWQFVEQSGEVPWTCELVAALKQRFALPGLLLGGLCGGAMTSIFAAERLNGQVQGLLLLEPPIFLSRPPPAQGTATTTGLGYDTTPESRAQADLEEGRLHKAYRWVRTRASDSRCGGVLRRSRDKVGCVVAAFTSPRFPPNTNLCLIESWQKLGAAGMPMLVLCAPGASQQIIRRDICRLNHRSRITIRDIARTNHLFTSGGGRQAVLDEVQHWTTANFPA